MEVIAVMTGWLGARGSVKCLACKSISSSGHLAVRLSLRLGNVLAVGRKSGSDARLELDVLLGRLHTRTAASAVAFELGRVIETGSGTLAGSADLANWSGHFERFRSDCKYDGQGRVSEGRYEAVG